MTPAGDTITTEDGLTISLSELREAAKAAKGFRWFDRQYIWDTLTEDWDTVDYVLAATPDTTIALVDEIRRLRDLEAAAIQYMSAFGQGYEAHGLPFSEQQADADRRLRNSLHAPTAELTKGSP